MKRTIWMLAALALLLGGVSQAKAGLTVVNFDSLPDGPVPDGYGGINWGGIWQNYGESQPPYNPHSAPNRVYDFVNDGTFTFSTPQVFNGAWFSGYPSAPVTFKLYDSSNNLLWTSGTLLPSSTPTFLSSGYSGLVSTVDVYSPSPDFFVMDDVTYGGPNNVVPEPASLTLMGLGALGLAGFGWRRRKQTAAVA